MQGTIEHRRNGLLAEISERNAAASLGDALLVRTDVLLPSGAQCVVAVEGGDAGERITLADGGAVLSMLSDMGLELDAASYRSLKRLCNGLRMSVEEGILRSRPVPLGDAASAVVQAANAIREAAIAAIGLARRQERARFRERVERELNIIFNAGSVHRDGRIQGRSESELRFDFKILLSSERHLLVDAPAPEMRSIAAVVLRQTDARAAHIPGLAQAIIYDEQDGWAPTSLSQLQLANVPLISSHHLRSGLLAAIDHQPE